MPGLNIITLPKTIDNDIAETDVSFGFDTALQIATEAIDRLHSTATSHHRIIVVEIMGHRAGWLTLGAGIAGGADVILIPEVPYRIESVSRAIIDRMKAGKRFSIVTVAEGAMSKYHADEIEKLLKKKETAKSKKEKREFSEQLTTFHEAHLDHTLNLTQQLEKTTGQESRLTILGHLQRGGTPSAYDRILASRLGTACAELISANQFGVMVAVRKEGVEPISLEKVAGKKNLVTANHPWMVSARYLGTSFGDQ